VCVCVCERERERERERDNFVNYQYIPPLHFFCFSSNILQFHHLFLPNLS
jgi:fatty acid desaturase